MKTEELLYWETGQGLIAACNALQEKARQAGGFARAECLEAFAWELHRLGIPFERNKYFTRYLKDGFPKTAAADFLVDAHCIVVVVVTRRLSAVHFDRLFRAMHAAQQPVGYILNAGELDGPRLYRRYLGQYAPDPDKEQREK